ncbi:MAG TPA: tetratricopeptide repeat protein [Spirochaetia bacterium]
MERKLRAAFFFVCVVTLFAAGAAVSGADARSAYLAGAQAAGLESYELAIERYKEALSLNPSYLEPMVGLAQAFLAMEEYDEAFKFVRQALTYDRNNPDIAVLEGRIRIGQGDVPGARALFTKVLDGQPNNVEARLGMAEAEIAEGKQKNALARYQDTLRLAPESTAALLSLAMLSDESGDKAAAGRYYELALRSHASDARVQLASAGWYAANGNYGLAEKHAQIALSLKPGLDRAKVLLGGIYLQTARYADAISTLRDVVSANRDDALAWYSLGLAYRRSGDPGKAITSFGSGLQARPDDEVTRVAQEATAVASLPMDDAQRKKMAAFHQAAGKGFEDRSFLEKALAEYRRALILDPTSRDGRVAYARIYKSFGFEGKYLSELQVLAKLGVKDTFVSDEIERLTSGLSESVSSAWSLDQYNIDRQRYTIPVYTVAAANRLLHPLASEDLARYFGSLLGRYDSVAVPDAPPLVGGFDEAFRAARAAGTDYFAILGFDEAERSFSTTVDLYLSRTGARIGSFNAYRTGNDRVRDGLMKLAAQVDGLMQPRGTLLVRKFGEGAIDLGRFQGVSQGDALVIVRKGGVRLQPDGPGLTYSDSDVVGDFKVTATDEAVSEGAVKGKGYFDLVNAGDQVVYPLKRNAPPNVSSVQRAGNILTRLFRIGR